MAYYSDQPLADLIETMIAYRQTIAQYKQVFALQVQGIYQQAILNLLGHNAPPHQLTGKIFNQEISLPELKHKKQRSALFSWHVNQTILAYLFEQKQQAVHFAAETVQYLDAGFGLFERTRYTFYTALIQLSQFTEATEAERQTILGQVQHHQAQLKDWAALAPMNHQHCWELVEAERYRVLEQHYVAGDFYDQAIAHAKTYRFIQEEALANELAAKFYLDWGRKKIAAGYMQESYYCYARWGANAKTDDLEKRYPQLLKPIFQEAQKAELERQRTETALENLIAGTAVTTRADFFPVLVRYLTEALGVSCALMAERVGNEEVALAYFGDGQLLPTQSFSFHNTPCERVYEHGTYYCELEPCQTTCAELNKMKARSYLGVALKDRQGNAIGLLSIFHRQILPDPARAQQILQVFAARAATELERQRSENALQNLIEGTAALTGPDFFPALVHYIAGALQASHAFVTEVLEGDRLRPLAAWGDGQYLPHNIIDIAGTTCGATLQEETYYCEHNVVARFPRLSALATMQVESYMGVALRDRNEQAIGTLCIYTRQPIVDPERSEQILRVFAARAAAELERLRTQSTLEQLNAELEHRIEQRTQELKNSEQDLRTIFNNIYDGIIIHDLEGTILDVNDRYVEMLGATREKLLTSSIGDFSASDAQAERIPEILQQVRNGQNLRVEWQDRRLDNGTTVDVDMSLRQVMLGNQPVIIASARDISDRKAAEQQLQHTNEELVRATRLKDEFLANMSHELRTPLNTILASSEVLQEEAFGPLNKDQGKYLKTVEKSGTHLLNLINDILDVSKIEAGQLELNLKVTNIGHLCESSMAFIKQQALQKHIALKTNIPPHAITLMIDERRILQSLVNLLNNAVKFTPEGGSVALEVSCHQRQENWETLDSQTSFVNVQSQNKLVWESGVLMTRNYIKLSVTDTGIGIDPEYITKLFKPFFQIDGALNRKYMGTGLGLVLVKQMTELHGGTISLTSEVGVGSCFSINLPYDLDATGGGSKAPDDIDQLSQSTPDEPDDSCLILLAEDNEDTSSVMVSYLEYCGYHLITANNGLEAVELTHTHRPDLILMDVQMPEVSGFEAMQQIRQNEHLKHIPIIALTALAMAGDQERCLEAGADMYLSKPVKLKQLVLSIQMLLP